jgi:hypothetical protein
MSYKDELILILHLLSHGLVSPSEAFSFVSRANPYSQGL